MENKLSFEQGQEKSSEGSEKFKDLSATIEQTTTRGDGTLELGENFSKESIDFRFALEHLKIHQGGEVAGSQFNGRILKSPEDVKDLLEATLPDNLQFDQYGRAELTLDILSSEKKPLLGWSGVKSVGEIKARLGDAEIKKEVRMPGGESASEDGVDGAWYPETSRNSETGLFEVVKDEQGNVKNPHGKFEPLANIAYVSQKDFESVAATNKITIILQKDRDTGAPVALTVFPGQNAPAFPTKINAENFKASTLDSSTNESKYWQENAFIKINPETKEQENNQEIEKKYLIKEMPAPEELVQYEKAEIKQGYDEILDDGTEKRVREKNGKYFRTIKSGGGEVRTEEEYEITKEEFEKVWAQTEGKRVEKTRYVIPHGKDKIELDVYHGDLDGLVAAEVEFANQEDSKNFTPPEWFGDDITENKLYKNKNLAIKGIPEDYQA